MSLSVLPATAEQARLPRVVAMRWPFGHALGEPFNHPQQMTVIHHALKALYATTPGGVTVLRDRWRRERYGEPRSWDFGTQLIGS